MVSSSDIKTIPAHQRAEFGGKANGSKMVVVVASPYGSWAVYFGFRHGSEFAVSHSEHGREFRTPGGAARAASTWLAT